MGKLNGKNYKPQPAQIPSHHHRYRARLIRNGCVIKTAEFHADPKKAYEEAHDGIDLVAGDWVEIKELKN